MSRLYAALASILLGLVLVLGLFLSTDSAGRANNTIRLSARNTISINSAITAESVRDAQVKLLYTSAHLAKNEPIYLTLNSPGGDMEAGEKLIETVKGLPQQVHTLTLFSASMSFLISQYLDTRYILDSGTMMSHRAVAGGLEGQVPGNLITRANRLLRIIRQTDTLVAKRAGMSLEEYQAMIADELWMTGQDAVNKHFADKVVSAFCDNSLRGPGEQQELSVFIFRVKVVWDKCPLIAAPLSIEPVSQDMTVSEKVQVIQLLTDRAAYLHLSKGH